MFLPGVVDLRHYSYVSSPVLLPTISGAFASLVRNMGRTVGDIMFRDRSTAPFLALLHLRLCGLIARFAAIAARAEAGTLRGPRKCGGGRRTGAARVPGPLPTGFHWLGKLVVEANGFGWQLEQMVLNDPEMMALLDVAPQAGRILRSVFWMVGRPVPPTLRRAAVVAPRKPAVRVVKPVRVERPSATERGAVASAANAEREGRGVSAGAVLEDGAALVALSHTPHPGPLPQGERGQG